MSIFIIEDSHVDASLMREMLETEGVHDIKLFGNGETAIDAIEKTGEIPQLFLIDVRLPGMTGIELVASLKQRPGLASIPAICISTSGLQEEIDAAYAAGASGYFVKPSKLEAYELIASAIHLMWFDPRISRPVQVEAGRR